MNSISSILKYCALILVITLLSCQKKDIPPVINDQTFSIDENSAGGTVVGNVVASDEDGQVVSYAIKSGNTNDAFVISETDGKITVNNKTALDYETTPGFTLLVEVKDENNEKADAHITVNLNNIEAPTTGLLLYMPFDGNTNDYSVNNNNGIDYTAHSFIAGVRSQALDFNGTSDYITLSNTINSQNGLSFSFWVKTRGAVGVENNGAIITKYSKINNTRCFMVYSFGANDTRSDNRLSAAFYAYGYSSAYHDMTKSYLEPSDLLVFPNPSLWTITDPERLVLDEWTHCVVNVTPTKIEIWLNDKLCTEKTREYTLYSTSITEPVYIGNNFDGGDGTTNHFHGTLDELRIYNRALTSDEIKTLFKE
jgi:hypothetical protein